MSYVTTDRELYNIELMVKLQKLFLNCEISGWGFNLPLAEFCLVNP